MPPRFEPTTCLVTRRMKRLKPDAARPRTGLSKESLVDGILAWECDAIVLGCVKDLAGERLTGACLVANTLRQTDVPSTAWIASAAPGGGLRLLYAESARVTITAPAWMTRYSRLCSSAFSSFLHSCRRRGAGGRSILNARWELSLSLDIMRINHAESTHR